MKIIQNIKYITKSSLVLVLATGIVYAATNLNLNPGDPIDKTTWDKLATTINNLENQVASLSSGSTPSGAVMAFNLISCPSGWKPSDGTNGTRDLRGVFVRGMNNFGSGNRSDGHQNPSIRGLGYLELDALPNIVGHSNFASRSDQPTTSANQIGSGALYSLKTGTNGGGSGSDSRYSIHFNASKSNGIYGRGGTTEVKVKNVSLIYCQKN